MTMQLDEAGPRQSVLASSWRRADGEPWRMPWPSARQVEQARRVAWRALPAGLSLALLAAAGICAARGASTSVLMATLSGLSVAAAIAMVVAVLASVLVGALRLQWLMRDLGHAITFAESLRVVSISQAAATFFFQIFGQIGSRGMLLGRMGVPLSTTVLVTLVERALGLGLLIVLSVAGAVALFGGVRIDAARGGGDLIMLLVGLVAAAAAVAALCRRSLQALRDEIGDIAALAPALLRASALTLAIQALTLAAFVVSALAFAPDAGVVPVAAASTIVMLASALPISFGGWGVRELSAVFALGAIGIGPDAAFSSALVVGVLSLAVVLALSAWRWPDAHDTAVAGRHEDRPAPALPPGVDAMRLLGWTMPLLAAALILFQVHAPVGVGKVNLNFADPFVLVGGGLMAALCLTTKAEWRVARLGRYVATIVAVLLLGLVHGWLAFGSNGWALTKTWGFLVLVGYGLTGAFVVQVGGERGRGLLLEVLIAAFVGIAIVMWLRYAATRLGIDAMPPMLRAEGFAQDANAYAFQAVAVLAVALAGLTRPGLAFAASSAALVAVVLSGSRSGGLAAVVVLAATVALRPVVWRPVLAATAAAAVLFALPPMAPWLGSGAVAAIEWVATAARPKAVVQSSPAAAPAAVTPPATAGETTASAATNAPARSVETAAAATSPVAAPQSPAPTTYFLESRGFSDSERQLMLTRSLAMFGANPLLGQGLGAFVHREQRADSSPLVIHSSYLWLLAELGIVGLAVFAVPAVAVLRWAWPQAAGDPQRRLVLLVMLAWLAMSLVQDLAYQRLAWLLLGAMLIEAGPAGLGRKATEERPAAVQTQSVA